MLSIPWLVPDPLPRPMDFPEGVLPSTLTFIYEYDNGKNNGGNVRKKNMEGVTETMDEATVDKVQ